MFKKILSSFLVSVIFLTLFCCTVIAHLFYTFPKNVFETMREAHLMYMEDIENHNDWTP